MKNPLHPPQEPCICIGLRRIAQKATEFYDKAIRPAGVSINQYSLLANIARREGCGTGELAQQVKLEKSTLVRTLQPLLRNGLIIDASPPGNRRREFHLTPSGKKVLKKAFPLWKKAQGDIATALKVNHAELMAILARLEFRE